MTICLLCRNGATDMNLKSMSLKRNLRFAFFIIIFLMIIPTVYSIVVFRFYTARYDRIILNVSEANRLSRIAKEDLENEIWEIVSGLKTVNTGNQYSLLRTIRVGVSDMQESSSPETKEILKVARRTEKTLEKYVQLLETQITNHESVSKNEEVMEQIRGVASLLADIFQDYIIAEIESAESANQNIRRWSFNLFTIQLGISLLTFLIAMYASSNLSKSISRPVNDMEALSSRIARGDLSARAELPHVMELDHLAENLNTMAGRIQYLIDENVREQKNLQKAEMKTLQAQITPHFLYNTFDTIIWLAEDEDMDEVIEITKAFSAFFRISLSKGHEWITVSQEIEHVTSYLKIQRVRYRNILDYEIDCDEGIGEVPLLKLLLQPLVENAIYHGIKNKRGRGTVAVSAKRVDAFGKENGGILFSVTDNGIGFTPERMAQVQSELDGKTDTENLNAVYGLYNVNKRLKLYYDYAVSLQIKSEYGKGTCVSFTVPVSVKTHIAEEESDV